MSRFQGKDGMWNAKAGRNDQNVFAYGAMAKILGLDVSQYTDFYFKCVERITNDEIIINRRPGLKRPPLSHDEAMGIMSMKLDKMLYDRLKSNHWVYWGKGSSLGKNFFEKLLGALIEAMAPKIIVRGFSVTVKKPGLSDRNKWWKGKVDKNTAHFAVRLNPAQTYAIKKHYGKKYHKEEIKFYAFYKDLVLKKNPRNNQDHSTRNQMWVMAIMAKDFRYAKKLKPWISFEAYFGAEHDFTIAIKKKYGVK